MRDKAQNMWKKLKDLFKEVADKFYTTTKNENCVKFTFSFS